MTEPRSNRRRVRVLAGFAAVVTCMLCAAAASDAHAQEASPAGAADERALVGYGPKGLFAESEDGNYKINITGQLQPRFDFERSDGVGDEDDETEGVFMLRRARTGISGHIFSPGIKYKFEVDWGRGFPTLKDAFIDFVLDKTWFAVKVGQFKVPTSRQFLNSSKRLELVDRALATETFRDERDIGAAFHNGTKGALEYQLGFFNGTGDRSRFRGTVEVDPDTLTGDVEGGRFSNLPSTFRPLFAARLGYNHNDIAGYSEADLEGALGEAQGFRFGVATSAFTELDVDENERKSSGIEGDFIMKIAGFELTGMGFFMHEERGAAGDEQLYGGLAQTGYAIAASELAVFEPVARYSVVVSDDGESLAHEAGGGLSVYFRGHRLKLQTDAFALIDDVEGAAETPIDVRWRTQVQLLF